MAAMGQGQAGGEGAAQASQGQGESQGSAGPDLSSLATTLGQQGETLEQMRQFLAGNPWQQQEQGQQQEQQDGGDIDLTWLDQEMTLNPEAAAQRLNDVISASIDQRAQALMAPVVERQNQMRINQEARDLADRFPDLQDAENAKKLAGPGGLVEQALQHADPNVAKQLAAEPWFWGLVHMSNKAAEIANNEGADAPGAAHLESGGGAGAAQMTPADLVSQIVNPPNGQQGSRVLDGI
jgi:hypothetical protein